MKKAVVMLAVLCLLICTGACAEETPAYGVIFPVEHAAQLDLDGDGTAENIEFEINVGEDGYDTGYTLRINDRAFIGFGYDMNRNLYALCLDEYSGSLLLMVSDYGPSDDHETTFYYWKSGEILPAGTIYAMPENMKVSADGVITAAIRGNVLHTWFHDADFALATGFDAEWNSIYYMYQIPRYVYPMGNIVTLKADLPLYAGMNSNEISTTIQAGTKVVLCATDDVEWVYIQTVEGFASGWMRLAESYGYECVVDDEIMASYDLFDGLIFAD